MGGRDYTGDRRCPGAGTVAYPTHAPHWQSYARAHPLQAAHRCCHGPRLMQPAPGLVSLWCGAAATLLRPAGVLRVLSLTDLPSGGVLRKTCSMLLSASGTPVTIGSVGWFPHLRGNPCRPAARCCPVAIMHPWRPVVATCASGVATPHAGLHPWGLPPGRLRQPTTGLR